ncbi:MAG: BMP family ABC transporter substrate-binding protein [Christensenellaceae bacterium]|jgi:basic membrane protein A|nr:BMP family ABC transporter substrate-binding protein [Christensenellaceae bacterium]
MKKILSVTLCILMLGMLAAGCGSKAKETEQKDVFNVAFCAIYPFDQAVWLSNMVETLTKYNEEHDDVNIKMVEVSETSQYEPKIRALAEQGIYDLIMTQFSGHVEATIAVAKDYPDIQFFSYDGMINNVAEYPNITEGQGGDRLVNGFLSGACAAYMTQTNKVCFIGGKEIESIQKQAAGWQQGVKYVNPDIEDKYVIADTFADTTITRELAANLYAQGFDVIGFSASGASAGVVQAAAEAEGAKYAIAFETHFDEISNGKEIAAALTYADKMMVQVIEKAKEGKLEMSVQKMYGYAEGVNDFVYCNDVVPQDVRDKVQVLLDKILAGEIVVEFVLD